MTSEISYTGEAAPAAASALWASRRAALRYVLGLLGDYWFSKDWKVAWAGVTILTAFQFGMAYLFFASNRWQQSFYDSIQNRQADRLTALMLLFGAILAAQVGATLLQTVIQQFVQLRWRTALTQRFLDRWLSGGRYAEIERLRLIDNPDQRISEDISIVTGCSTNSVGLMMLGLNLLGMVVAAATFAKILLETAEPIRIGSLSIPGSTVWYALIYTFVATIVMTRIGRPYVRAKMQQQHREADFRAGMIRVRANAAQIAFARSSAREREVLDRAFGEVRSIFKRVIFTTLGLQLGQGVYERIGSIFVIFLIVPRYFAGAISFGQVMAANDAFGGMVGRLSYIIQSYSQIGTLIACVRRLRAFDAVMDLERPRGIIVYDAPEGDAVIRTEGLSLNRPDGAPLLRVADWTVRRGERWVVRGASGCGKSSLLRALVGLWPDGTGRIALDCGLLAMVVPQRLYLPYGTLKTSVCFPEPETMFDDAAVATLLDRVGLGAHCGDLHVERNWQEDLSPGEQQRVALARILLHRPELLILDEATSALDPDNAHRFHRDLMDMLPGVTLVSVVHDDRLAQYHTHRLSIVNGIARAAEIGDDA